MIPGFATVLAASANDRRDLFIGAGNRLGTVQQNIEKYFWVCWTLDALFNGLAAGGGRGFSLKAEHRFPRVTDFLRL
jgi:hypothetical protein